MKTVGTIIVIAILVLIGIWLWNRRSKVGAVFARWSNKAEEKLDKMAGNTTVV